jgi:hypothetical protein
VLSQQVLVRQSGHTYGSGIAINGDGGDNNEQPNKEKTKKAPKAPEALKKTKGAGGTKAAKPCKCGSATHRRSTHKECTWIRKNNEDKANNAGNS